MSKELKIEGVFDLSESKLTSEEFQKKLLRFIESVDVYFGGVFDDTEDDEKRCWKCGKKLTPENTSNIVYTSNPPRYTCKDCEKTNVIVCNTMTTENLNIISTAFDKNKATYTSTNKTLRPFKDCNELIEAFQKKIGKETESICVVYPRIYKPCIWIRHKELKTECIITAFGHIDEYNIDVVEVSNMNFSMKELLENWEFLDGSPVGVME